MSSIPGIDSRAPERTETSSGSPASPSRRPARASRRASASRPRPQTLREPLLPHVGDARCGRDREAGWDPLGARARASSRRRSRPCRRAARAAPASRRRSRAPSDGRRRRVARGAGGVSRRAGARCRGVHRLSLFPEGAHHMRVSSAPGGRSRPALRAGGWGSRPALGAGGWGSRPVLRAGGRNSRPAPRAGLRVGSRTDPGRCARPYRPRRRTRTMLTLNGLDEVKASRRQGAGRQRLAPGHAGGDRRVRPRHGRRPVDPRRRRAGEGDAVRRHDRPRLLHALARRRASPTTCTRSRASRSP